MFELTVCPCYILLLVIQVSCPSDYRSWLETMYVLFGTKWCKLFTGPAWSHVPVGQVLSAYQRKAKLDPIDVSNNYSAFSKLCVIFVLLGFNQYSCIV